MSIKSLYFSVFYRLWLTILADVIFKNCYHNLPLCFLGWRWTLIEYDCKDRRAVKSYHLKFFTKGIFFNFKMSWHKYEFFFSLNGSMCLRQMVAIDEDSLKTLLYTLYIISTFPDKPFHLIILKSFIKLFKPPSIV